MDNLEQRMDRIEQHLSQLIAMVAKMAKDLDSFKLDSMDHFNQLEQSIEHLALKWVETDRKLYFLRERQSE